MRVQCADFFRNRSSPSKKTARSSQEGTEITHGYDASERVNKRLQAQGKTAVISPKRNRTRPLNYDRDLYKARHLIEDFFCQT